LDVEGAAKILRDYKGLNDQDIGLGNEKAVNQFIAHHSVIFKPEELKVWVSTPPYQLGEYIGYDLQQVFADGLRWHLNPQKIENIPADAFLQNPVYHKLIKYKVLSEKITEGQDGISGADSLIIYNPEFFMTYRILGDYYHELGQSEKANQYYRIALEKEAPSYALLEYVREKLEE
jgi:tetratricopeptide (TPR) repeat protein